MNSRPRRALTLPMFNDVVRSAEMMAHGSVAATHPRELIAERILFVVRALDSARAWPTEGPHSDHELRRRAVAVAEVLRTQGERVRMPA